MIKYVIDAPIHNERERYKYAKLIRAQLNDDEQLLLYYNAMADTGSNWLKGPISSNKKMEIQTMCPMARFRMIKNLPIQSKFYGIDPHVQFNKEITIYRKANMDFFEMDKE